MNVTENIMMNGMIVNWSPLFQTWEHPRIPLNRLNPRSCMIPHMVRIISASLALLILGKRMSQML